MPIFTTQLSRLNYTNPTEAIRSMANHIRYIQEQLEYTLMNLDSSNITEIETDVTNVTSSTGGVSLTGDTVKLTGSKGETFEAGIGDNGLFQFKLNGKNGEQILYLTSDGKLVITDNATFGGAISGPLNIDGGEW